MAVERLRAIPKAELLMMWAHVILEDFKFLSFPLL